MYQSGITQEREMLMGSGKRFDTIDHSLKMVFEEGTCSLKN